MAHCVDTNSDIILSEEDRRTIESWRHAEKISAAMATRGSIMLLLAEGYNVSETARAVGVSRKMVYKWIRRFCKNGVEGLSGLSRAPKRGPHRSSNPGIKKAEDENIRSALFPILHSPPSEYNINRTSWRLADLKMCLADKGIHVSKDLISEIIKSAGYSWRKARVVLTSKDPHYCRKLAEIQEILSKLGDNEFFFSIDEFGPVAIKMRGGKRLVAPNEYPSVPQFQKSKGHLIMTAALELKSNQITHFYSAKKNTTEMFKLLEILLRKYSSADRIYLSWDAASWHVAKRLKERVKKINSTEYRAKHSWPYVELAPLPSGAQFLNVIESVFSGMARAIIHNSDYQSVDECKAAIDRYVAERNRYYRENPKRAGNKIWGQERVKPVFSQANNCKDPKY